MTKHVSEVLPKIATLSFKETPKSASEGSLPASRETKRRFERCLATPWQRKWLDLEAHDSRVQEIADAVERLAVRWFQNGTREDCRLVIIGNPGVGKTHAASALRDWAGHAAMRAFEQGHWSGPPPVEFSRWPDVCARIEAAAATFLELRQELTEPALLVLDDIGAETDRFRSGTATSLLAAVLDARLKRFSLITTNVSPDQWAGRWDARVADRLLRNSVIINLGDCPSYSAI